MNIGKMREKAEGGNIAAQAMLGVCHLEGIGVEVDYTQAVRGLSGPASQGVPRAADNLARM